MSEYQFDIKVSNGLIWEKIRQLGHNSIMSFCKETKLSYSRISGILNFKISPLNFQGEFRPVVYQLCDVLNCTPDEIFTATQVELQMETNKRTIQVTEAEAKFQLQQFSQTKDLETIINDEEMKVIIDICLDKLTPREKQVLSLRHGLKNGQEMTLDQIGKVYNVDKERIRQIEAKALRKLRGPKMNLSRCLKESI